MWVSGSSLLQGMFVSTSEFLGVLSVLAHFVCRLSGVLATCQIILKTPILRTDDPSSQHSKTESYTGYVSDHRLSSVVANFSSVFSTAFQEAYGYHYALLLSLGILVISLKNRLCCKKSRRNSSAFSNRSRAYQITNIFVTQPLGGVRHGIPPDVLPTVISILPAAICLSFYNFHYDIS